MVELTVGSRFYYKGKLCEVVETGPDSICGTGKENRRITPAEARRHQSYKNQ